VGFGNAIRGVLRQLRSETSPLAAFNLGVLLAENGDTDGTRDAYQHAAAFRDADITKDAMRRTLQLGILLAEKGTSTAHGRLTTPHSWLRALCYGPLADDAARDCTERARRRRNSPSCGTEGS
jgi:hypothetical protein